MMKKIFFLIVLLIAGCAKKESSPADSPFGIAREAFFNTLQKPEETAAKLQATGADFNAALPNDAKKWGSYAADEGKAAANMGVYMADLNYCVAYKETDRVSDFFYAVHSLSKIVGVEKGTLDFILKRYEQNFRQSDSLTAIVGTLYLRSTQDLKGTEREKYVGIAAAAYQIENLHLALGIIEGYPKDMVPSDTRTQLLIPLFRAVLDQKDNVVIIYNFLKSTADISEPDKNPNYPYYAKAFEELIALYNRLNIDSRIADNKGIELMNDQVVKELREKVDAIRSKIVSIE